MGGRLRGAVLPRWEAAKFGNLWVTQVEVLPGEPWVSYHLLNTYSVLGTLLGASHAPFHLIIALQGRGYSNPHCMVEERKA